MSYITFLSAYLLPYFAPLFGTSLPLSFTVDLLILSFLSYYILFFFTFGFTLTYAFLGLIWLLIIVPYVLLKVLSRHNEGAVGAIGCIITIVCFFIDFYFSSDG